MQVQLRRGDVSWDDFLLPGQQAAEAFQPHVAASDDASCVLFSSGTTGAEAF